MLCEEHHVERVTRVTESITRVGSAVFMAAFTTFAAGFSMTFSSLSSFRQMGQFLMTISMFISNVILHSNIDLIFSVHILDIRDLFLSSVMRNARSSWYLWFDSIHSSKWLF